MRAETIRKLRHKPRDGVIFSDETPSSIGEMIAEETSYYVAEALRAADDDVVHFAKSRHFALSKSLVQLHPTHRRPTSSSWGTASASMQPCTCSIWNRRSFPGSERSLGTAGSGITFAGPFAVGLRRLRVIKEQIVRRRVQDEWAAEDRHCRCMGQSARGLRPEVVRQVQAASWAGHCGRWWPCQMKCVAYWC